MLALLLFLLAGAAQPSVAVRDGNVEYRAPDGSVRRLTKGGGCEAAVLSPDGHTIAFIHVDREGGRDLFDGQSSLWIVDAASGSPRRLLTPKGDDEPKRSLALVHRPFFSLDGGYVYVEAEAWVTSAAIHQVSVTTGKERYVADGWIHGILRTGPYRGDLVVSQHRYHKAPRYGSYDPAAVIRPDGKVVLKLPGEEPDVDGWVKARGWILS